MLFSVVVMFSFLQYQPSDWLRRLGVLHQSKRLARKIVSVMTHDLSSGTSKPIQLNSVLAFLNICCLLLQ